MSLSPIIREASFGSEGNDHKRLKSLSHRLFTKGSSLLHIQRLSRNSIQGAWKHALKPNPSDQRKGQSLTLRNDTDLMRSPDTDYQTSRPSSIRINPSGSVQERDEKHVDCFLPKRKIYQIRGGYRVFIHSFDRSSVVAQSLKRPNSERCTNNPAQDHDLRATCSSIDRKRKRRRSSGSLPLKQIPKPTPSPNIFAESYPSNKYLETLLT